MLYGELQRGDYSQINLGSVSQPVPRRQPTGARYSVEAYPLYRPQLEPGEGRELVEAYCNTATASDTSRCNPRSPQRLGKRR